MSHSTWAAVAAATIAAAGVVGAAPQASASSASRVGASSSAGSVTTMAAGARYRGEVMCKAKGRWAKGYVETYGRPTGSGAFTRVLEWGWAIQKTSGNHSNSTVYAYKVINEGGSNWRWSGGPGYKGDAVEDSRFHKGKMINNTTIGYGPPYGEHAIVFTFVLDKGTGGECNAWLRVPNLKWKG
ncbi:hypothetical protein [Actinomadura rudentiformis]|uniref:DUF4352 domain-containing protein n=1 Tax=Actinomadura rudentiformis TaxID=359158 RepID=A0A6H9Z5P7_9ACTN|nr:hypothetical protein [Actinomadura rudentiformis]KAB2350302.1 hypothetical protein F8566_11025 [Actinomadura rudentiformis]